MKKNTHLKYRRAYLNAKASLAIEGMFLTKPEEDLLELRVLGKVTDSDFIARALQIAKNVQS